MKHPVITAAAAAVSLPLAFAGPAYSAAEEAHITDYEFSFEGPFGTFDQHQLQRGLQVYMEICSACHGMKFVPFRSLGSETGPGLPPAQVRAVAEYYQVADEDGAPGDTRAGGPADNFPPNDALGAPDLSLMAKARAGFHGPVGLGLNQLFYGSGGAEYIASLLADYTGETKEEAGVTLYGNSAFPGGWISMAPPLAEGVVEYQDGEEASIEQMAKDVSAFLMFTAEPKMIERKEAGFRNFGFLILLFVLVYMTNKKIWAPVKNKES